MNLAVDQYWSWKGSRCQFCGYSVTGKDEYAGISTAVPSWSVLCLRQAQGTGVPEYRMDC